jgi:hypothetical protein
MDGYSSVTLWTPGQDFGITALCNQALRGNAVLTVIALRAFAEHFNLPQIDWEKR